MNVKTYRLSRPCYDKPHRCPGWAGGGTKHAEVDRCDDGRIHTKPKWVEDEFIGDDGYYLFAEGGYFNDHPGSNKWRFGKCDTCDVVTWPFALRWLDWHFVWGWRIKRIPRDIINWWRYR